MSGERRDGRISPVSIRSAEGPADIETVRGLLREYREHLTGSPGVENMDLRRYQRELETLPAPYETLLLAFVGNEAAGCVLLKTIQRSDEKACELKRLWVRPTFRGLGIGRELTEAALVTATKQGYTTMYLDTVPVAMQPAHRLYQELGFEPTDQYNDNPVSNVVFFRRSLV